jgi:hypothetical protein
MPIALPETGMSLAAENLRQHRSANRVGLLLAMPALPGIATQGDTLDEALEMIQASHAIFVVFAAITTGTPTGASRLAVTNSQF